MAQFNMEYGNLEKPTGNAIVYWQMQAKTEEGIVTKIVAANFIVSPLTFNKNTIAATFPPIILDTKEMVFEIAKRTNIDIIRGEDFSVPIKPSDFLSFFKKQLNLFNKIVLQYSRRYAEFLFGKKPEEDEEILPDEKLALEEISRLSETVREAYIKKRNKQLARQMIIKIRQIEHKLNSPHFKYDIENLIGILENPDERVDQLSDLYFKKFKAIQLENYEEAEQLKNKIQQLTDNMEF